MTDIKELLKTNNLDTREARLLLAHALNKDASFIVSHPEKKISKRTENRFLSLVKRRSAHEPIAYLIGSQLFYGREFFVDKNTLIPRPETEFLAESVVKEIKGQKLLVIDIGTGSGCLAITLALECPGATVIASDCSSQALGVARKNAKHLKAKVRFVQDDLIGSSLLKKLNQVKIKHERIVFIANLPYIPAGDKKRMMPDVTKYEPSKALFVHGDGTMLIVKLLKQIAKFQKISSSEIYILLEIDPRQRKLSLISKKLFPRHIITAMKDQFGKNRFLSVG